MVSGPYPSRYYPDEAPPLGTDQVKRKLAFVRAHPYVSVLSPRESGTAEFIAIWTLPDPGERTAPVVQKVTHSSLMWLLDWLDDQQLPEWEPEQEQEQEGKGGDSGEGSS